MHSLRTIGIATTTVALLLSATVAFAQERAATSGINQRDDYRAAAASSTTARMKAAREAAQSRMESEREKVTQRLTNIRDKAKQEMAKDLATRFEKLNSTWTDHFIRLLDHYEAILQKIQDRANIAGARGLDITATNVAILSAETAIASARDAVLAQADNTYALAVSSIPTSATTTPNGQEKIMQSLRASFQTLHRALFNDLFALRDGPMKDARTAVHNALQTLSSIPRVDEGSATSSTKKSDR